MPVLPIIIFLMILSSIILIQTFNISYVTYSNCSIENRLPSNTSTFAANNNHRINFPKALSKKCHQLIFQSHWKRFKFLNPALKIMNNLVHLIVLSICVLNHVTQEYTCFSSKYTLIFFTFTHFFLILFSLSSEILSTFKIPLWLVIICNRQLE